MQLRALPLRIVLLVMACGCAKVPSEEIVWRLVDTDSDATAATPSDVVRLPVSSGAIPKLRGPARAVINDDARYTFARPMLELAYRDAHVPIGDRDRLEMDFGLLRKMQGCERLLAQVAIQGATARDSRWVVGTCTGAPRTSRLHLDVPAPPVLRGGTVDVWVQARPVPEQGTERRQFAIDRLPVGARLAFSYGVESPGWENHAPAVRFEVAAEGEETPLFSARLDPASDPLARRWFDASIDLSTHAGSPLTLTLQTSIEPGDPGGAPTVPVWGDPVVLAPGSPTRAVPRNLLLISIDTERAPSLSTYGRSRVTSPFFDALANEGALFEKAVVQSTLTPVSHMSLFTGLYPYAHGITDLKRPSDLAAYSTMAELLRRSGYATGAVTEDGLLQAAIGFERGFDRYLENKSPDVGSTAGHVESTFAAALDWLKLHRNQRWFLFVHTYQVHAPYTPPPQYQGLFGEERDLDRYEEEIRYTDDQLHALWAAVGALVLADRTLLIVTSDHGEEFGEHGASDHGSHLYDETLLVPLLMRAPGMIPTGLRVREPVALVDVLPTVLGILGLPALHQSHGESLTPLFDRDPAKRDAFRSTLASRPIYAEAWGAIRVLADGSRDSAWKPPAYALRAQNQKLIWTPPARDSDSPGRMEAYDLANDPGEEQDLWISHSAELTSPSDMLRAYASSSETTRPVDASAPPEPDPATAEKLRALGYIR